MSKGPRIDNEILLQAGVRLMEQNGKKLVRLAGTGRAMKYSLPNGETVRARTCNDHILIILSDKDSGEDAKLNIEGTDWLLVVMPEIPRSPGNILAYLVPTKIAVSACKDSHAKWLATKPNTSGGNKTWNMWFDDGHKPWNDFANKWSKYLLDKNSAISVVASPGQKPQPEIDMKAEIEMARQRISNVAGVPLDAVKVTIEFGL
jgi:hypothetical protein